jgi:hypothetical protein
MSNMVQQNVRERKFPCQEGAKRICMEETLRLIQLIPTKVTRTGSSMAEIASDTTQISENIQVIDNASRSVVAIRKDAMHKKRQIFYLPDANGSSRVCENRMSGKKDEVSFVVTRIDEDRNVAVGLISRIIKQKF